MRRRTSSYSSNASPSIGAAPGSFLLYSSAPANSVPITPSSAPRGSSFIAQSLCSAFLSSIIRLGQTLASFCNGVESSCQALDHSLDRRSIPLDSASATFMQSLNRRVSSLSGELNLLETMSFGTVSFEELLGHCYQVYKKNQADLVDLTDRLRYAGCHLSSLSEDDAVEEENVSFSHVADASLNLPDSYPGSVLKGLDDDSLLGDATCLANLGLSEACLATIASKGGRETYDAESNFHTPLNCYENRLHSYNGNHLNSKTFLDETDDVIEEDSSSTISILEEDYEGLPSYMKSLVSWEGMEEGEISRTS